MKIYCFAGPNGSGKSSTIEKFMQVNALQNLPLVNADIIAKQLFSHIEDEYKRNLAAAQFADNKRNYLLQQNQDFMFETVLSDAASEHSKLKFLQKAKEQGADIVTIYMLTRNSAINVERVKQRISEGGHPVAEDKIISRYNKCLVALPDVLIASNSAILYDNSQNYNTELILHKNASQATIFAEQPAQDEFLQTKIVAPLQEKSNLNFLFSAPPKNINIYSFNDLQNYIETLKTKSSTNKKS